MEIQASHRALVRRGGSLQMEDVLTEAPRPGGLLIELSYVGVCGTDLQILNGARPDIASVLGHEGIGIVARAGEGAALKEGDQVVFNPVAELSAGRILGHNVAGLFQQYITLDAPAVESGLVLPAGSCSPPICGALAEPLASVIYAQELISRAVARLRTAVVLGAGPVGLLAAHLLREMGVGVLLVHRSQGRLQLAVQLGLVSEESACVSCEDLPERILRSNGGHRLDAALICTNREGAPLALQQAVHLVREGGCIDVITNYPEGAVTPEGIRGEEIRSTRAANVCGVPREGVYLHAQPSGRRITLTGHRGTSADHLSQAIRRLQSASGGYRKLITHVLSLREAVGAIDTLAYSRARLLDGRDCIKAVIDLTLS